MLIKHKITGAVLFEVEGESLRDAYLQYANLRGANLHGANLRGANLHGANLHGANLRGANLQYANLQCANLQYSNLQGADLRVAYLQYANLQGADLQCANLQCADLQGANLQGAYLDFSCAAFQQTRILPEGSIIGWKKLDKGVIAKLKIHEGVARSHAFGRKCRAEWVEVLDMYHLPPGEKTAHSRHDGITTYSIGAKVVCHKWDDNWQEECTGGIHFFITRAEAEAY